MSFFRVLPALGITIRAGPAVEPHDIRDGSSARLRSLPQGCGRSVRNVVRPSAVKATSFRPFRSVRRVSLPSLDGMMFSLDQRTSALMGLRWQRPSAKTFMRLCLVPRPQAHMVGGRSVVIFRVPSPPCAITAVVVTQSRPRAPRALIQAHPE
jgi:hypothetical protein